MRQILQVAGHAIVASALGAAGGALGIIWALGWPPSDANLDYGMSRGFSLGLGATLALVLFWRQLHKRPRRLVALHATSLLIAGLGVGIYVMALSSI